jgi:RNA polymerase sigma-70 factor (ECF subfamily)
MGDAIDIRLAWMSDAGETGAAAPTDTALPLRALIEKARAGDLAAFEQLMALQERRVYRTALRLLRHTEDAQDAAQEVFLRLHRHLGRFDLKRRFETWLYRIIVNVCRDANQRRRQQPVLPFDEAALEETLAGTTGDPFEAASLAEQRAFLSKALLELPEKERVAVILRDLEGLATNHVARILGSSETTVRSQISRGRLKIKEFRIRHLGRKQ